MKTARRAPAATSDNSLSGAGAVYIFERSGVTWAQTAYIKADEPDGGDNFGDSLSLSGERLLIGAYGEDSSFSGIGGTPDDALNSSGAAFLFTRSAGTWTQRAFIKAPNPDRLDSFGFTTVLTPNYIALGSYREQSLATGINGDQSDNSGFDAGAVYVWRHAL